MKLGRWEGEKVGKSGLRDGETGRGGDGKMEF